MVPRPAKKQRLAVFAPRSYLQDFLRLAALADRSGPDPGPDRFLSAHELATHHSLLHFTTVLGSPGWVFTWKLAERSGVSVLEHLSNATVLVVGGTQGVGREVAIRFAQVKAKIYVTDGDGKGWSDDFVQTFEAQSGVRPTCISADVTRLADTRKVVAKIAEDGQTIDVFIGGLNQPQAAPSLLEQSRDDLLKALEFNSWPFVGYLHAIKQKLEKYPSRAIAISWGSEYQPGRDYESCAQAVLETFCRYMAIHLMDDGVAVNAIRPPLALEQSKQQASALTRSIGDVALALCSGLMDGISGEVIEVGGGA